MAPIANTTLAIDKLNRAISEDIIHPSTMLSSVAAQLNGNIHPYYFEIADPEYILLLNSSAVAIARDALKLGLRCQDHKNRQIVKKELAARVFAVYKKTYSEPDWFEATMWRDEFWKPMLKKLSKGVLVVCTMFAMNYGRAHCARAWNCHWPTITNFGGIMDTPLCAGLKWADSFWDGLQKNFVYGAGAAIAYAIPSILGWHGTKN